jgi:hypothetical protein
LPKSFSEGNASSHLETGAANGKVGQDAFAVIRDTIAKMNMQAHKPD